MIITIHKQQQAAATAPSPTTGSYVCTQFVPFYLHWLQQYTPTSSMCQQYTYICSINTILIFTFLFLDMKHSDLFRKRLCYNVYSFPFLSMIKSGHVTKSTIFHIFSYVFINLYYIISTYIALISSSVVA